MDVYVLVLCHALRHTALAATMDDSTLSSEAVLIFSYLQVFMQSPFSSSGRVQSGVSTYKLRVTVRARLRFTIQARTRLTVSWT